MIKRVFLTVLLLCALAAPSWAACAAGDASGTQILTHGMSNGLTSGTWTIDGSTDQTANFNNYLANCAGSGPAQLDCSSNNPYYINGAVAGGRFNLIGCGRGNGGLKFGPSGSWEMQVNCISGVVYGGYSTVKDLFIQGTTASAFTEDSGTCGGNPASSANNVFLNFYCTGVGKCIVDHGNYNVVDHMWANNFTNSALYADGVGPIWHDIALQNGSSSHPCIYYSGASLIMNTFSINGCGGDMVIEGVTSGNACQGGPGNWNHISDGFFDAGANYPSDTTASVLIKNLSSGNCQMGSTHFTNVGFESEKYGLYIETDNNYSSFISSVTCSGCQLHNNSAQGFYITGWGVGLVRFNDSTITSNGGPYDGSAANFPNATIDCPYCSVFFTGVYLGNVGWNALNLSYEGPNEGAKNTYTLDITSNVLVPVYFSNTLFDTTLTTISALHDPGTRACWNIHTTSNTCE